MENIKREELKDIVDRCGGVVLIDVQDPESYEERHIPNAINIPLEELKRWGQKILSKDENIFLYCDRSECTTSLQEAEKLTKLGTKNVSEGGIQDWNDGGMTIVEKISVVLVGFVLLGQLLVTIYGPALFR